MPDTTGIFDQPLVLITLLAIAALVGIVVERLLSGRHRARTREWYRRHPHARGGSFGDAAGLGQGPGAPARRLADPTDQLRIVMEAAFTVQPILNRSEARVFRQLDQMVLARNPGWRVLAQVSLGEVLHSHDADAFSCVNSKRVDLLLMDEKCLPRHAIEYQGGAHYIGTAAARDAVKKEALRRAGVGYHEVVAGLTTPSELGRLVERIVDRPKLLDDSR